MDTTFLANPNHRGGLVPRDPTMQLYVYKDWTTEGNGRWRLAWAVPGSDVCMPDESSVTGQPYFKTMREAIAFGEFRYERKVERADWN